ncbi:hypothetical protein E4U55_004167 [Claviceps digitariae]|nr:hypothetical protein E4U55_004167 [Claviceps digitariae]
MQLFNSSALAMVALFAAQTLAAGCTPVNARGGGTTTYDCDPASPGAKNSWFCPHSSSHIARMGDAYAIHAGDAMNIILFCTDLPSTFTGASCDADGWTSAILDCPTDAVTVQTWEPRIGVGPA